MKKQSKRSQITGGQIFGVIFFISLLIGLVVFAAGYTPGSDYSNSFFEDVSNAVQWR